MEKNPELLENVKLEGEEEKEISQDLEADEEEEETAEDMESLYAQSFQNIAEGEVVKGTIIEIRGTDVVIDVGFKSEGVVPLREFGNRSQIKVGDEVSVLLEATEDQEGRIVLSKWKADRLKNWENVKAAFEEEKIIEGTIVQQIKGGFNVNIGVEAFLPTSQVAVRPTGDLRRFLGQKLPFKIIKMNKRRRNVVISHRIVREEEDKKNRIKLLEEVEKGQLRRGKVKNITDFGAFIDLGGMDGLLHITDISWGRVSHPSEVLAVGDEVEVVILNFDKEKQRISLGLKQKTPNPWMKAEEKYPVGSKVKARVVNITSYGAFVQLEEGMEGLVHISEMSWTRHLNHPSEMLAIGDIIEVVVLSIDKEKQKISLGMKQVEANPWLQVEKKYPAETKIEGRIRNITDYGAFIELEEGIDGLIHVSDMSWSGRVGHPSEIVKKGETVEAVVLAVDPKSKKISLGIKQLTPDPWLTIEERYKPGQSVKGKVTKLTNFGAFLELEKGVEGLAHLSELSEDSISKPEEVVSLGQEVIAKVMRVSAEERRIGLSLKDVEVEEEEA
ncbi:MAG: 30S ribosomal protein S1 [Nitrospirae bacterium]|nr:30S ribosomal protein S1 [Nitrospirota bacterium]